MKTLIMMVVAAALLPGCAVVPVVPYDSGPYYGAYYSAPPAVGYGYAYYGPRYYGTYTYYRGGYHGYYGHGHYRGGRYYR